MGRVVRGPRAQHLRIGVGNLSEGRGVDQDDFVDAQVGRGGVGAGRNLGHNAASNVGGDVLEDGSFVNVVNAAWGDQCFVGPVVVQPVLTVVVLQEVALGGGDEVVELESKGQWCGGGGGALTEVVQTAQQQGREEN